MYSTCLHCNTSLGANAVLELLPIGRRIAFDAAQGRLWVICRGCGKWNLVPFDTRLEVIDACERLYHDTATRYSTGTIGVARLREGLDLVRIGPALRPEFASWRYGESYRRRRRTSLIIGGVGVAGGIAAIAAAGAAGMVMGGGAFYGYKSLAWLAEFVVHRRARFRVEDPADPAQTLGVGHRHLRSAVLAWEERGMEFVVPRRFAWKGGPGLARWQGDATRVVGRRITGGLNLLAGKREELESATELLAAQGGDLEPWLTRRARDEATHGLGKRKRDGDGSFAWYELRGPGVVLGALPHGERLAVEMWLNEDIERRWLDGELRLLEREWREAERIAKIADDLVIEGGE